MMNPSPFETAQMISNRFGNVQQRQNDLGAIDQILASASSTGNQQDLDTAMNQILTRVSPERQQSALAILQNRQKQMSEGQARQQNAIAEQNKYRIEQEKQSIARASLEQKERLAQDKQQQDLKEKRAPYESAATTIKRMKEIRKGGNLGFRFGTRNLTSESRKDNAEYERLGKSLIALSSTIPIRNRQEFEVLSNDLFDPKITDAAAEGILSAMDKIISDGLNQYSENGLKENIPSMQVGESAATELKASNFWR